MNTERVWCRICNKVVAVVVEEGAGAFFAPLIAATAGGALGASKRAGGGLLGGLLGFVAGAMIRAAMPKAQRLICGDCRHHLA